MTSQAPPTPPDQKKQIRASLIAAGLYSLIASRPHVVILTIFIVPAFLIWLPYTTVIAAIRPQIRTMQLTRIAIWIGAFALVAGMQFMRHIIVRQRANGIVSAVNAYKVEHGHYPAALDEVGIHPEQLIEQLGLAVYSVEARPQLSYAVTYLIYDMYTYDFEQGSWTFVPD